MSYCLILTCYIIKVTLQTENFLKYKTKLSELVTKMSLCLALHKDFLKHDVKKAQFYWSKDIF